MRGVSDMLTYGPDLLTPATSGAFPSSLPLLVYHGEEDPICSVHASREFVEKVNAGDKKHHAFKVS